jgi:uncharacterized protein YggE
MKTVSLVLLFAALGGAQSPRPASVQASATATVSVAPDQARMQIGVVSQAATASAAAAQNATLLQSALDKLKAAAGPKAEVKTLSYSLTPNFDFSKGAHTLKGYTATNTVQVTTDDLASVGKIIDAATQSGANEVSSLEYALKDQSQARAQALRKAALQARAEAEAMASALSLKLGKVIFLDEGGQPPILPRTFTANQTVAMATPIEQPQAINVQATVTLTVALEP